MAIEITAEQYAAHKLWRDTNGAEGTRLNLSGAYLSRANLSRADLSGAYLSRANLCGAYLSGAYLSGANLSEAYLSRANLSDANLSDAYLSGAYLSEAYLSRANLSDANLSDAALSGADLSDANLSRADLSRANLSGAIGITSGEAGKSLYDYSDVPLIPQLNTKIMEALDSGGRLDMRDVHICATTHCVAGWSVHVAGEAGYALERKIGWRWAAAAIFRKSTGVVPHFFASNERALKDLRARAAKEQTAAVPETP